MIINLSNDLTKNQANQITYLGGTIATGGTQAGVRNTAGFNASWAVQLGQTGEETAEIMLLGTATPSGTSFTFGTSPSHIGGTFFFSHANDTPLYQIHYDQFVLYRSTTGTAGSFSSLATVSITPDNLYTQYNDTTGSAGYAYYAQYYNSVTGDLSGSSSIFLPGGPTFYSLQKMKQRTKSKLYSAGYLKSDDDITDWINEWYELMTNEAIKVNQGYMVGTASYNFGTAGLGTITATDFKNPLKLEVSFDGGNTYTLSREIPINEFTMSDSFSVMNPRHAWVGETVVQILPNSATNGVLKLTYSQRFSPLVNDSDELTQTLKAYTTCCVEYCLAVAYGLDQKDTQQQEHFQKFLALQNAFIAEVTPRDMTGAKSIDLVEDISGMNEDIVLATEYYF